MCTSTPSPLLLAVVRGSNPGDSYFFSVRSSVAENAREKRPNKYYNNMLQTSMKESRRAGAERYNPVRDKNQTQ